MLSESLGSIRIEISAVERTLLLFRGTLQISRKGRDRETTREISEGIVIEDERIYYVRRAHMLIDVCRNNCAFSPLWKMKLGISLSKVQRAD